MNKETTENESGKKLLPSSRKVAKDSWEVLLAACGLILTGAMFTTSAQAGLIDRGNGMIYDDVLDITWLQDANYAKTSGYDADGRMTWWAATSWATDLVFGGYDDWRLASLDPTDTSCSRSSDSGNFAYGCNGTNNELAYMFYENLGLHGYRDSTHTKDAAYHNTEWGTNITNSYVDALTGDTLSIDNLVSSIYWSSEEYASDTYLAWRFNTHRGTQYDDYKEYSYWAWAVRDGDVAEDIPEPGVLALFSLGLLGLLRRNTCFSAKA